MSELKHFVSIKESIRSVRENNLKTEALYVYPDFDSTGQDIMKKGGKFYAVLDRKTGMWSQDESTPQRIIDQDIDDYILAHYPESLESGRTKLGIPIVRCYAHTWNSGILKQYNQWLLNQATNFNYIQLDEELTFKSTVVTPDMYRSLRLSYDICESSIESYERLMSTLYNEPDRDKLEWAIGSILSGDSKSIDKLIVIYSFPGFGKSTVLNIIKDLFNGYWSTFVVADLVSKDKQFATAAFKDNPLVAIDIDGKMAKIESPIINGLVSHEDTMINEKNKSQYSIKPNSMLFIATNDPVDFRDTKIGIARRLLDVYPSKRLLDIKEYDLVTSRIRYELPGIAYHCLSVYKKMGKRFYNGYTPTEMIRKTNYIWNFLQENQEELSKQEYISRRLLYNQFKEYCKDNGLTYDITITKFTEQALEYYDDFEDWHWINGKSVHNVFGHLNLMKLEGIKQKPEPIKIKSWLDLIEQSSILDELYSDRPAQYDVGDKPETSWACCKTTLKDIDTHKLHWLSLPRQTIRMDFDKKGPDGKKNLELNIQAVLESGLPPTYCEISKSGGGLHLYYIYDGDVKELSHLFADNVEIKTAADKENPINPDRRLLTKCNNLPLATISTGLPLKEEKKVVNDKIVTTEAGLRATIRKCLNKEVHADTRSNVDWIYEILERAYNEGLEYDVSDLYSEIYEFACKSTHQSTYCKEKVSEMKLASKQSPSLDIEYDMTVDVERGPIIIYDIEVYPNLLLVCWSYEDDDAPVVRMYNPSPDELAALFGLHELVKPRTTGFNNRGYDAHIICGRITGDSIYECYNRSYAMINGNEGESKSAHLMIAYRFDYMDLYDISTKKQSLKKWEYELDEDHDEMEIPWNEPVPEELWERVGDYCEHDVKATKALYKHLQGDIVVREALADVSGLQVIDTNRQHITRIMIGDKKSADHVYTDLATGYAEDINGIPYPLNPDIMNSFPGYEYKLCEDGKYHNMFRGVDVGRGGYVYAVPGMYMNVSCQDVTNMHGASIIALNKFGEDTKNYINVRKARNAIKHRDREELAKYFDGKLVKYLDNDAMADALNGALKLFLNSTYGIAAASFENPLKDPRDKNNIIALRGALFMKTLQDEVEARGYKVVHIKTDSIKIANPDDYILDYVKTFGELYGYEFEHECTYERFCLVNDAVYIAKYDGKGIRNKGGKHANEWTATGAQFAEPYVFKTLFSHEPIIFKDKCQLKSCSTAFYIDYNEGLPEGEHNYHFVGKVGQFCPVRPGSGGGELLRENGKWEDESKRFSSATGSKGYLWLESRFVKTMGNEDCIDESYYRKLVDAAVTDISKYGDFEWFVGDNDINSYEYVVE